MRSKQMTPFFTGQVDSANPGILPYLQRHRPPFFRRRVAGLLQAAHLRLHLLPHMPERHQDDIPLRLEPKLLPVRPVDNLIP